MPRYQPSLTVGGTAIPCDFDPNGTHPVVLDGLSVVWGREGLYEPTEPSQLTARLLDPDGRWGSNPALHGQPVLVSTELGVLFRGTVDTIELHPVELGEDPTTTVRAAWEVLITAVDVIAAMSKAVVPGPEGASDGNGVWRAYYGPGYWYEASSGTRRDQINAKLRALGIATVLDNRSYATSLPPDAGTTWDKYFIEPTIPAGPTLYELAQSIQARADQLTYPNYKAGSDRLETGLWPAAVELALQYDGQLITLGVTGGNAYVVPCADVIIEDEAPVRVSVVANIAAFEVTQYTEAVYYQPIPADPNTSGQITVWPEAAVTTAVTSPGGQQGQGRLTSPAMIGYANSWITQPNTNFPLSESAARYAARIVPLIAELNGRLTPPPLTYDLEATTYAADVEAALLATWAPMPDDTLPPKAWVFPGARYENLQGWGPAFQVIGGELVYEQGWQVTQLYAPSRVSGTGTLTISQLVTTPQPLFSQYASSISLATLGIVQKGI